MSCDRYTEAIVDHACGAEITADAAAHLQRCDACRRMFDEQRHLLQDVDRELEVALAIEPSARFVAGAMAKVEDSAVRSRTIAWRSAAAAAAAVLILAALGSLRFVDRRPADRQEPASPPPPRRRSSRIARRQPLRRPQIREALPAWRLRGAVANARPPSCPTAATGSMRTSWFRPNGRWRSSVIWLSSDAGARYVSARQLGQDRRCGSGRPGHRAAVG